MHDPGSKQSRPITPIGGPEAFEERGKSADLSQAAFILSAAAGVAGESDRIEYSKDFPLPELAEIAVERPIPVRKAIRPLGLDEAEYVKGFEEAIPSEVAAGLARDLYDKADATTAATLFEASLHSPTSLVRTAAAIAALETTGVRLDVIRQLEVAARKHGTLEQAMARPALARVDPGNETIKRLPIKRPKIRESKRRSHTAVVTHGTFASRTQWWKPNGSFYAYLNGLVPPLHMHSDSFKWSGEYSSAGRDDAAEDLSRWIAAEGLTTPDFFAHSHGVTVANLATAAGVKFDRLVMLCWPVHDEWLPNLRNVNRVIDIRVHFDLVVLADRGGQRLPRGTRRSPKVKEHIHGWFKHSLGHDPQYWEKYDLPSAII